MPTPKKGARLGGSPKHHNMIMSNLATELFRHGRIKTTKAKAKNMQPVAERMITFAKRGDLHARRQVLTVIRDKDVVHKLFADIGPAAAGRSGGYTRVVKLAPRKGDGAEMAMIELVDIIEGDDSDSSLTEAPRRRWSLRRSRNNMSKSAREREEAVLAAEDSGDFSEIDEARAEDEDTAADAVPVGSLSEKDLGSSETVEAQAPRAEDQTEVSPEDVEARLAADDADADDAVSDADDADDAADASDADAAVDAGDEPAADSAEDGADEKE